MASASRRTPLGLGELLQGSPSAFNFFQAARLLQVFSGREAEGLPPRPVGYDLPPHREPLRFSATASLAFPPAAISALATETPDDGGPPRARLSVAFIGLTGPSGVLPQHYTSLVIQRLRERDTAIQDFFDLFNHRYISLFFRAWLKYRFPYAYEFSKRFTFTDPQPISLKDCLAALTGLFGMESHLAQASSVEFESFLGHAPAFARSIPSAIALEASLQTYFTVPVRIVQFVEEWITLPEHERSSMPNPRYPQGRNCQLGVTALAGARFRSVEGKFRVRLGPLTYPQYADFMPGRPGYRRVVDFVRMYVGPEFDFDIQPVLQADQIPQARLDSSAPVPPQIGRNLWLNHAPPTRDFAGAAFAA